MYNLLKEKRIILVLWMKFNRLETERIYEEGGVLF
jgi:hypothetical protein